MTKIRPFKGVIYNQDKIKDLSRVVCPPYDIISPRYQEFYHQIHPYNLIHILLGKDIPGEDKYERARVYFQDWLKNKILIQDQRPAIYYYSQQYKLKGEKKIRLGFIALLSLDNSKTSIYCHEHTRIEPKEDRLKLLRQVKANLSPIFVIFSDKKRIIQSVYRKYIQNTEPMIDITDDEKIVHKLWRLDSEDLLAQIQFKMQDTDIFIADGHHRYEVGCIYRNEMIKKLNRITGEEGFNYIMAYFTNIESQGLTILPIHRLIELDTIPDMVGFKLNLNEYFDIEGVKDKERLFFLMEKAGNTEHVIGMYKDKQYWLLRLKNVKILDKMITDKPKEYKSLDVVVLNHLILKKVLGLDLDDKRRIRFSHNANEIIEEVNNHNTNIAFFLNPVKVNQIMAVALKGERMPPKSTYFYPKVLSGLVVNKLE